MTIPQHLRAAVAAATTEAVVIGDRVLAFGHHVMEPHWANGVVPADRTTVFRQLSSTLDATQDATNQALLDAIHAVNRAVTATAKRAAP